MYSVMPEDMGLLGVSEHLKRQREQFGIGNVSLERAEFQRKLIEFTQNAGVLIKWGHKLESLEQSFRGMPA